jgi:hypothetical protein
MRHVINRKFAVVSWWQSLFAEHRFRRLTKQPAPLVTTDAFNFLMDQYLRFYEGDEAPLLAAARQQFPGLSAADAGQVLQKVSAAYKYAAARHYDARDGKLPIEQADEDIQARLPQLQQATLQRLLAQTKAGAYR